MSCPAILRMLEATINQPAMQYCVTAMSFPLTVAHAHCAVDDCIASRVFGMFFPHIHVVDAATESAKAFKGDLLNVLC
jgi:hypothetical protein